MQDAIVISGANLRGSALAALFCVAEDARISVSILLLDWLLCLFLSLGARITVRARLELAAQGLGQPRRRVLIYGAGRAGLALPREIRGGGELLYDVVGFLDDSLKAGSFTQMAPVLGGGNDLARLAKRHAAEEVLIAIPSAQPAARRRIYELARTAGVVCKSTPALADCSPAACAFVSSRESSPKICSAVRPCGSTSAKSSARSRAAR